MKPLRLFACILCTLAVAPLELGCAVASSIPAPANELRTYAIIAADDQGTLSRTELDGIVDTLAQFLIDQGYVRNDDTLVDDPDLAAVVFRIQIVWSEGRASFAISSVTPDDGSGSPCADASPAYAESAPPPCTPPGEGWEYDPWLYDDSFGYSEYTYGPYCPFFAAFPLVPYYGFYGFDHHRRPSRLFIFRPPIHRPHREHRPPAWDRYRNHVPSWQPGNGRASPPWSPWRHWFPSGHDRSSPPAWNRNSPAPDHRARPPVPHPARPRLLNPGHRPGPDSPPAGQHGRDTRRRPPMGVPTTPVYPVDRNHRLPVNDGAGKNDGPAFRRLNHAPDNLRHPDSAQTPAPPAAEDRLVHPPGPPNPPRPLADLERHPALDRFFRPAGPNVSPPPAEVAPHALAPPRFSPPPAALPAHEPAEAPRFSPPPLRQDPPPRQDNSPAPPHSSPPSPPPQRQDPPPQRSSSPSPSHSSQPSSSRSDDGARSNSGRERWR